MGLKKRGLLLVVFLLSVVFTFSAAAEEGCYLYAGGDERLYCQSLPRETAAADCANYANCDLETHFAEGVSCAEFPEDCEQVTCSVDCTERPIGQCEFLGGVALTPEEETRQCGPACCKIAAQNSCTWETTLYSCVQYAQDFGLDESDIDFDTSVLSESACALECGAAVPPTGFPTAGTAEISGSVSTPTDPASGAIVFVVELGRSAVAAGDGTYTLTGLPTGTFHLRASKPGFPAAERTVTISEDGESLSGIDFLLQAAAFQGVTGTVYVDSDNDGVPGVDERRHGAKVYLDDIWRDDSDFALDKSSPSYGKFTIAVGNFGEHQLSATYPGGYASEPVFFTLSASQPILQIDLFLMKTSGICTPGQPDARKKVDGFSLSPLPGEKAVQLHWQKPCPEVVSYEITRQKQGETTVKTLPAASATQTTVIDADPQLEWGATYTYTFKAVYASGQDSEEAATASIMLGKEACAGKFDETVGWKTFCLPEDRHQIYSCDANNELSPIQACVGDTFYCAPLSGQEATCKDAGVCSIGTDPFGLYAERAACYGTEMASGGAAANFCTYDSTNSAVNACKSCATISSCFDYQSQDACVTNSCLTASCQWVDGAENAQLIDYSPLLRHLELPQFVTPETGSGYCTEANYQQDDFCSLCSNTAPIFENFFCTADVCSSLGRCLSSTSEEPPQEPLSSCASCGETPSRDANCYTYLTEDECAGGQDMQRASGPELLFSDDQCGWQRCAWVSDVAAGEYCVKDGDANTQDDCAAVSSGERQLCRTDITPPVTAVLPEGFKVISLNASALMFRATDNNGAKSLWYCLTPPGQDLCTEFGLLPDGDFTEVRYPGTRASEEVSVSFQTHPLLEEQAPDGETFILKFYSVDKYANQEEVRETPVYVDVVPPQFEIAAHTEVAAGKASVTFFLDGTNEPMSCTFALQQELPLGGMQSHTVERGQPLEARFSDLSGLLYQATVQCTDAAGNRAEKTKLVPLDTEEHITVQSPVGTIKTKNAVFSVATTVAASCELYVFDAGAFTKVTDFQTDAAGLQH
ncbi:carboxypeptidase regulatory-like domain-containing protein, partial [Candidatus Woesearchaeota archaeon]|nr:carboxypeptidase regulatory-like domain-containing protein [Candidatus Woesearchaeota archaeon]